MTDDTHNPYASASQLNAQTTQQPAPGSTPTGTQSTSGLAVAGMILGIIAFLIAFIPLMNLGSIIMGILAIVLAGAGMVGISKGKNKGKGIAIAGIVLGILSIVVVAFMYGSAGSTNSTNSASSASSSASTTETASTTAAQQGEAQPEYVVSIDDARVGQDYEGKEVAIVRFTWTNNSDKARSFAGTLHAKAFQNGVESNNINFVTGVDSDGEMAEVKPGGTVSFEHTYALTDHSEMTVEVKELISFDNTILATKTFTFE